MSYDLYVTRRRRWTDTFGDEIGAEEWMALVDDHPQLERAPQVGPWAASWEGGSTIEWSDGNVVALDPEDELIERLLELAERLGATLQGEDGEVYLGGGRVEEH